MKAVFLGSKAFGLRMLKALHVDADWTIIHPDDANDARSNMGEFSDFARQANLDMLIAPSMSAAREMLSDIKPDIAFVCGWYWLLNAETLALAPKGFFGIHNSLLPKYRGGAPLVWSILNGDETVGSTFFKIEAGMDDGDIYHQVRVNLSEADDVGTTALKIESAFAETLSPIWREICDGTALPTKQDNSQATYCGQRQPCDGLIDWRLPARAVHNFIRAQTTPYPGAFTLLDGQKVTIWKSSIFVGCYLGTPGQVLERRSDSVLVSCGGNTAIQIHQASIDGIHADPRKIFATINARL